MHFVTATQRLVLYMDICTYHEVVVHGERNLESGVIGRFHSDVVRDEVWSQHEAEGDESSFLLGFASCVEGEREGGREGGREGEREILYLEPL